MLARIKNLFNKKRQPYPVEVYVKGKLVHAGNATISVSATEPFTVVFEDPLEKLLDDLVDPTFLERATNGL